MALEKSGILEKLLQWTKEGAVQASMWKYGGGVANDYIEGIRHRVLKVPFLLGRPQAERVFMVKVLNNQLQEEEGNSLTAKDRERIRDFLKGKSVKADRATVWFPNEATFQMGLAQLHKLFALEGNHRPFDIKEGQWIPLIQQEGNRVVLRYDYQVTMKPSPPEPAVLVEIRIVVSSDDPEREQRDSWLVDGVELVRARSPRNPRGVVEEVRCAFDRNVVSALARAAFGTSTEARRTASHPHRIEPYSSVRHIMTWLARPAARNSLKDKNKAVGTICNR